MGHGDSHIMWITVLMQRCLAIPREWDGGPRFILHTLTHLVFNLLTIIIMWWFLAIAIVNIIMLLVGAFVDDMPYLYFIVLRFVVCISSIKAMMVFQGRPLLILFAITCIIFNPIIIFHLPREIWCYIDIATSILWACVSIFIIINIIAKRL